MTATPAAALRQRFVEFFEKHGHTAVKSSPLVPANDPTLMFVNAGMVQFKDVFVGADRRPYSRATSSQKCMRVSGKHNDLGQVGRTARHHTFFEMLGNFSFGDYFKEEAIGLAWQFVTHEVGLDPDRLYFTVFGGEGGIAADDEARQHWQRTTGAPANRILSLGMKDNFWAMGDTGPCGPCTELHYDTRPGQDIRLEDFDNGRLVEIWNLVFMQFDRQPSGEMLPLPAPSVDTGMGLERLACMAQGETSNYHTDLFAPLLECIAAAVGKPYRRGDGADDVSMRVIADHSRATAFLVADGVQPSNEGRGYVLRRIMRRAIRHGKRLGFDDLFFHEVCDTVAQTMGAAFPELEEARALIAKVASVEEEGFRRTLDAGLRILEEELVKTQQAGHGTLAGDVAFRLYDTYGFPPDLTEIIAAEHRLDVDQAGFDRHMAAQKELSKGTVAGGRAVDAVYKNLAQSLGPVRFVGYEDETTPPQQRDGHWRLQQAVPTESPEGPLATYLQCQCEVVAIVQDHEAGARQLEVATAGEVSVVLNPTPFYGEAGGQVGDRGILVGEPDAGAPALVATVRDSQRPVDGLTVSRVRIESGELKQGARIWAGYQPELRQATRIHHSATHLLHAALRQVLGSHVKQAGSRVDGDHLRFDYSHFEPLTREQRAAVEAHVQTRIERDRPVLTEEMAFEAARQKGAIALFGEKYGDVVRVVTMDDSIELCGGTHARSTGDLGLVVITRDEAVASGVRRIEAEAGEAARRRARKIAEQLARAAELIGGRNDSTREEEPVLQAVAKTTRRYAELVAELKASGDEPQQVPTHVSPLPIGADLTLQDVQRLRASWEDLAHAAAARGAAAEAAAEAGDTDVVAALLRVQGANRANERLLQQAQRSDRSSRADELLAGAQQVGDVRVLAARVDDGLQGKALRELADELRDRLGSGVLCIGSAAGDKVGLLVTVSKDLTHRFKAGNLIRELAPIVGGRGGGKPELAQAGGSKAEALGDAFSRLRELVAADSGES